MKISELVLLLNTFPPDGEAWIGYRWQDVLVKDPVADIISEPEKRRVLIANKDFFEITDATGE